jgi:cell division protein FtsI/penicillin-binding protein 2
MRSHFLQRILILFGILTLFVVIVVVRLLSLQFFAFAELRSESEHERSASTGLFERGSIFFTTKNNEHISAASLKRGATLAIAAVDIQEGSNPCPSIKKIATEVDCDLFEQAIKRTSDPYQEIVTRLSSEDGDAINALDLPGVMIIRDQWRYYPADDIASHVIGYFGYGAEKLDGLYGVERYYKDVLARNSHPLASNFFSELFDDAHKRIDGVEQEGDVILTIEPTVQSELQKELKATMEMWHSRKVMGIIMDPRDGEILALAQYPTFNPNNYSDVKTTSVFSNSAVEHVFEMGSIMKILTMAAGFDTQVISNASTYNDTGSTTIQNKIISNFDGVARGVVPIAEVLRQSLNMGAAHVGALLGANRMEEYFLTKFKLGEETGIDLPSEVRGLVSNLEEGSDITVAVASYGQGIATTPIATIRALSAVANGGYLVQPHIVSSIARAGGIDSSFDYNDQKTKVLRDGTSENVSRILVSIVDEKLKEGKYKMDHYSVAAKTGTAQIPDPRGGYYEDRYLHSFFGYAPAYDPQFVILLINLEPVGAKYSSETLTEPFVDLVKFMINYYEIPPDR